MLPMARCEFNQVVEVTHKRPDCAYLMCRSEGGFQQPNSVELLKRLAIRYIGSPARNILA
ncbi:MAG: hypothetical protein JWP08_1305 [Bryobacterales bacterium]|nr:hypothetical protein [Bryobacterales bacterium]